jgi:hypothetical protein
MKLKTLVLAASALTFGALAASASDLYEYLPVNNSYDSANSSWASIPSGAFVAVEGSAANSSSQAYSSAWGGGLNLSIYLTNGQGGSTYDFTHYSDTISYSVWVSGTGYASVEVVW